MADTNWLLSFFKDDDTGAPWGYGTAYAGRLKKGLAPWDTGCTAEPLIGGYAAMGAMRSALEGAIADANKAAAANVAAGESRGKVYIAGWRLNPLRDMSVSGVPWPSDPNAVVTGTAIDLLMRLVHAGVLVRVLVWMPVGPAREVPDPSHCEEHLWLLRAVQYANLNRPGQKQDKRRDIAIVGLDARTAEQTTATHHQKMMVIRPAYGDPVAFCGGVDLAFTRRDAPANAPDQMQQPGTAVPVFMDGDWQSGDPDRGGGPPTLDSAWPRGPAGTAEYPPTYWLKAPKHHAGDDLPPAVYGSQQQIWHDQHVRLTGPIVSTLENQFRERWIDAGTVNVVDFSGSTDPKEWKWRKSLVVAENGTVEAAKQIKPLANGNATVQMWRTIPRRPRPKNADGSDPLFARGEFTVLAGYAHALEEVQNLAWIHDQYFWSLPYARYLRKQIQIKPNLGVVVVLPPRADNSIGIVANAQHRARLNAIRELYADLLPAQAGRIAIVNLWDYRPGRNVGIYCHAKTHVYDGTLLVCGSANINRRSLLGDSEIAVAIVDREMASTHLHNLWKLLFPKIGWPTDAHGKDLDVGSGPASGEAAPGPQIVAAVTRAATDAQANGSFVFPDGSLEGQGVVTLPNGQQRSSECNDPSFELLHKNVLESNSAGDDVDENYDADLAQVCDRVYKNGSVNWYVRDIPSS